MACDTHHVDGSGLFQLGTINIVSTAETIFEKTISQKFLEFLKLNFLKFVKFEKMGFSKILPEWSAGEN